MALILEEESPREQSCFGDDQVVFDCNVDPTCSADRSPGVCKDENADCVRLHECTDRREGLASVCAGLSVMEPEDFGKGECGDLNDEDGCCNAGSGSMELKEGKSCREDGNVGSVADCGAHSDQANGVLSAGSPGNDIQLDEHRDSESADFLSSEGTVGNEHLRVDHSPKTNLIKILALPAQRSGQSRKNPAKKAPSGKVSRNSSSDKELSVASLCLSGENDCGVSGEAPYVERKAEAETDCNLDGVVGLLYSKPMLHSSKGQKPCRSKSRGFDSASKISTTHKARENKQKSVNKRKVKEDNQHTYKVESLSKPGVPNLDAVPVDLDKQYTAPQNAWVLCDACNKWRRIAAELADLIDETKCTWTCRENRDKDFNDCSIPQEKTNAEINAELEISDASGDEDASSTRLHYKTLERRRPWVPQQKFASIKTNQFLHRNRKKQSIKEVMVCLCKPPKEGQLGCGEDCLNRMLNIECVRGTCPCGDFCSNQQFQKWWYSKLEKIQCRKKGFGLRSLEFIRKGQFVIEYVGEVLDMHAYEARQKEYALKGHRHFYFMTLNTSEVIDACAKGNLGRFVNHSCDPNCRTEKWIVNGEVCIGLFALRDIKKGEEVTFDYNFVRVIGAAAKKCHCGSSLCQGYIGGDPHNTEIIVQDDSDEEYVEPVMIAEDGVAEYDRGSAEARVDSLEHLYDVIIRYEGSPSKNKEIDTSTVCVEIVEVTTHTEESDNQVSLVLQQPLPSFVLPVEVPHQTEDVTSRYTPVVQQEVFREIGTAERSSNSSERPEMASPLKAVCIPSEDIDVNKGSKANTIEDEKVFSGAIQNVKTFHLSSFVKKGRVMSSPDSNKIQVVANKAHVLPVKPKRLKGGSVEEKLNELLDTDGGISKRKDSAKNYLKLLFLTAQSGDSGSGEAIKSNRDLSIILDALLKTKSHTVLMDIINKNGLRVLHNIMKMCRRDFNKIPILRKLLMVLEYLAEKPQILTQEHIAGGPPCPGMESFSESILSLTEHGEKREQNIDFKQLEPSPLPRIGDETLLLENQNREGVNFSSSVHCIYQQVYLFVQCSNFVRIEALIVEYQYLTEKDAPIRFTNVEPLIFAQGKKSFLAMELYGLGFLFINDKRIQPEWRR